MTTHIKEDCPAMAEGDEMLDLFLDEWVYDCEICKYVNREAEENWAGGFRNGLALALDCLDEVQAAIAVGRSKLQVFRLLITAWGDDTLVPNPQYLPLSIMNKEELSAYSCPAPTCVGGTDYSHTEDGFDLWLCSRCGHGIWLPVENRPG